MRYFRPAAWRRWLDHPPPPKPQAPSRDGLVDLDVTAPELLPLGDRFEQALTPIRAHVIVAQGDAAELSQPACACRPTSAGLASPGGCTPSTWRPTTSPCSAIPMPARWPHGGLRFRQPRRTRLHDGGPHLRWPVRRRGGLVDCSRLARDALWRTSWQSSPRTSWIAQGVRCPMTFDGVSSGLVAAVRQLLAGCVVGCAPGSPRIPQKRRWQALPGSGSALQLVVVGRRHPLRAFPNPRTGSGHRESALFPIRPAGEAGTSRQETQWPSRAHQRRSVGRDLPGRMDSTRGARQGDWSWPSRGTGGPGVSSDFAPLETTRPQGPGLGGSTRRGHGAGAMSREGSSDETVARGRYWSITPPFGGVAFRC